MRWAGATVIGVVAAALSDPALAQSSVPQSVRSTASGVYTEEQATRGRDTYQMQCKSCHTPASHTGPTFASWWDRKPLSDLYQFVTTRMPKNEPGSLQPDEYADLIAYLLKLNDLPSGSEPLPADSVALKKIRIDMKTGNRE
jgi:mono/diheme cytochrome c family protein